MESSIEPPNKKLKLSPLTFSSLPEDIRLSILARIPRSYYPKLSLVSKRFRSLFPSEELDKIRTQLGVRESCVYVCLQSPTHPYDRRWFSLWIKPDNHQTLTDNTTKDKTTGNWLLPIPSLYSSSLPISTNTIGSIRYGLEGQNSSSFSSSTDVWVYNNRMEKQYKVPSMTVARKNAFTCSHDGKLYVMAGCEPDQSTHWAEVFDPTTQTWEPLPDPGPEIRSSPITMIVPGGGGDIYLVSKNKYFVYLINERSWEVNEANLEEEAASGCEIGQVLYEYFGHGCWWYDSEHRVWKNVQGLSRSVFDQRGKTVLDQHDKTDTKIVSYGDKLVMLWVGPERNSQTCKLLKVWCAVILLERHTDGETWGEIEWIDNVLTLPGEYADYTLLHCMELLR